MLSDDLLCVYTDANCNATKINEPANGIMVLIVS